MVDGAGIGPVGRVVFEEERVHLGVDEVVDRDHLDLRRALDDCPERLTADPSEAIDPYTNGHFWFAPSKWLTSIERLRRTLSASRERAGYGP